VNFLYSTWLEGMILDIKTLFDGRLLRQSLGCEKMGGISQAQRNNNNCTQLLPSSTGTEKRSVLDFHITSSSQLSFSSSPGSGEG